MFKVANLIVGTEVGNQTNCYKVMSTLPLLFDSVTHYNRKRIRQFQNISTCIGHINLNLEVKRIGSNRIEMLARKWQNAIVS